MLQGATLMSSGAGGAPWDYYTMSIKAKFLYKCGALITSSERGNVPSDGP